MRGPLLQNLSRILIGRHCTEHGRSEDDRIVDSDSYRKHVTIKKQFMHMKKIRNQDYEV